MNVLATILRRPLTPNHQKRESAIEAKIAAEAVLDRVRANLARLQNVVQAGSDASQAATAAKQAAEEARKQSVRSGCDASATEHQRLAASADQLSRVAADKLANAKLAAKEILRAEEAVVEAENELRWKDEAVRDAERLILVDEATALLERGARIAADYSAWRLETNALWNALDKSRGDRNVGSGEAANLVLSAIYRAAIPHWDNERSAIRSQEFFSDSGEHRDVPFEQALTRWRARLAAIRDE